MTKAASFLNTGEGSLSQVGPAREIMTKRQEKAPAESAQRV